MFHKPTGKATTLDTAKKGGGLECLLGSGGEVSSLCLLDTLKEEGQSQLLFHLKRRGARGFGIQVREMVRWGRLDDVRWRVGSSLAGLPKSI